ncbi:PREDICTED: uncharacterized protein LOC105825073 [Propithecus coquereli]|uniref:uncharacterized protein LOC105825073 n=1 Tax=Propithecus coquereli TaxID=379532 RepID=UPI00063F81DB|nr:PREDICTED: uncharacterized protein LOC105825073 [Propithecus coquereli]
MPQLSLSWLGLGPVAASPWLLLLLVGASWLLARVLAWTYAFYDNCSRLRCFPQPPKRSWFWGHLGMDIRSLDLPRVSFQPSLLGCIVLRFPLLARGLKALASRASLHGHLENLCFGSVQWPTFSDLFSTVTLERVMKQDRRVTCKFPPSARAGHLILHPNCSRLVLPSPRGQGAVFTRCLYFPARSSPPSCSLEMTATSRPPNPMDTSWPTSSVSPQLSDLLTAPSFPAPRLLPVPGPALPWSPGPPRGPAVSAAVSPALWGFWGPSPRCLFSLSQAPPPPGLQLR